MNVSTKLKVNLTISFSWKVQIPGSGMNSTKHAAKLDNECRYQVWGQSAEWYDKESGEITKNITGHETAGAAECDQKLIMPTEYHNKGIHEVWGQPNDLFVWKWVEIDELIGDQEMAWIL